MLDLGANLMTDHYFLQSTTTIGLAQAFGSQLKKNVFACVRQEQISYRTSSVSAQCNMGHMSRNATHKLDRLLTLMPLYHCHKPVFRPKMAIFRRAGMREGGLPLSLAFQYLILMI